MTTAIAKREAPDGIRPIEMGCYTLHATGLTVKGRPTLEEHERVGVFITHVAKASPWWLADLVAYGETREDWGERRAQLIDSGATTEKTLSNAKYVAENVHPSRRRESLPFALHSEVAGMTPKEQEHWLDRAEEEGWTRQEMRSEIRASKRRRIISGQAKLEGQYRVIYADPPWLYRDSGPTEDGSLGKAERHYPGMSIEELCKLPVAAHACPNAVLFIWVTAPFLLLNPGPREVIEAWGFDYRANFVWDKVLGMPGHYNHVVHEHLLLCVRGDGQPDNPTPQPKSIFTERRTDQHSEKPKGIRSMIHRMYQPGPYLELFGREKVEGWDVFGNDARLWSGEV